MKKYDIVRVDWVDAWGTPEINSITEVESYKPKSVSTIGYLISKNKDRVVVCATLYSDYDVSDTVVIPKNWTFKIVKLKE